MRRVAPKAEDSAKDWLNWGEAMQVLSEAQVGTRAWQKLADWCGDGLIDTRASVKTGWGKVERDCAIDFEIWAHCRTRDTRLDPFSGTLNWDERDVDQGTSSSCTVIGPQFRASQLLSLLPHLTRDQVARARGVGPIWLSGSLQPSTRATAQASRGGGRPSDKSRWQSFYFALIELAKAGRLNADSFDSASALSEEVLTMMGEGAFSEDHVKGVIGQVFKRFCRPN